MGVPSWGRVAFCVAGLALALQAVSAGQPTATDKSDRLSAWTGVSSSPDSLYAYAGGAYALGGNMDAEGMVVRIGGGGGEYVTDGADPRRVDHYDVDLMLGYRMQLGRAIVTAYAGSAVEQHRNDDPGSDLRGTQFGIKAQAEAYMPVTDDIYLSAFGNYSTAFESFNVSAKAVYRLTETLWIGPETAILGRRQFDEMRTGIATAYRIADGTELAVSTGYAWGMAEDKDGGIYGGINLYTRF